MFKGKPKGKLSKSSIKLFSPCICQSLELKNVNFPKIDFPVNNKFLANVSKKNYSKKCSENKSQHLPIKGVIF